MIVAQLDPDVPLHFNIVEEFDIAYFSQFETIIDVDDLRNRFKELGIQRAYHPLAACKLVHSLNKVDVQDGGYFIVGHPGTGYIWRYTVYVPKIQFGFRPGPQPEFVNDPFGEILQALRGQLFAEADPDDVDAISIPDCGLSDLYERQLILPS